MEIHAKIQLTDTELLISTRSFFSLLKSICFFDILNLCELPKKQKGLSVIKWN